MSELFTKATCMLRSTTTGMRFPMSSASRPTKHAETTSTSKSSAARPSWNWLRSRCGPQALLTECVRFLADVPMYRKVEEEARRRDDNRCRLTGLVDTKALKLKDDQTFKKLGLENARAVLYGVVEPTCVIPYHSPNFLQWVGHILGTDINPGDWASDSVQNIICLSRELHLALGAFRISLHYEDTPTPANGCKTSEKNARNVGDAPESPPQKKQTGTTKNLSMKFRSHPAKVYAVNTVHGISPRHGISVQKLGGMPFRSPKDGIRDVDERFCSLRIHWRYLLGVQWC